MCGHGVTVTVNVCVVCVFWGGPSLRARNIVLDATHTNSLGRKEDVCVCVCVCVCGFQETLKPVKRRSEGWLQATLLGYILSNIS